MYKIQTIDIISFLILIAIIIFSITLRVYIKKKLKDIEGDSEVYVIKEGKDFIGKF